MSIDIKIQNRCDHYINWERIKLESDLKTINVRHPVAAVSSVVLRINNQVIPEDQYDVLSRPEFLIETPPFYLYMKKKVRVYQPIVEVKYTTMSTYCPKCVGMKVIDDLIYKPNGDMQTIEKEFLLIQQVEKYIVTKVTSNIFHSWVGTSL